MYGELDIVFFVIIGKLRLIDGLLGLRCTVVVARDEECDKVLLYWSPEMCASESGVNEPLAPMMSASTHVSHIHFHFHNHSGFP